MGPVGEAAKLLRPMGAEEYLAWEASQEERHELLEGLPYAMAGVSEAHNFLEALALPGDSLPPGLPPGGQPHLTGGGVLPGRGGIAV